MPVSTGEQSEIPTPKPLDSIENSPETGAVVMEIREIAGTDNFYNAAAWEEDGKKYLFGRQVVKAGGIGEPDVGTLVLKTLNLDGNIVASQEIWKPGDTEYLLEDPRALPLRNGKIAFGLTAVDHVGDAYVPYPAVLTASTQELLNRSMKPTVIRSMGSGDQTAPIGEHSKLIGKNMTGFGSNLFVYRPENSNHSLRLFEYQDGKDEVKHIQNIDFPTNIPWAELKIGTTIPPIWLNNQEAILLLHGIKEVDEVLVYSIGSARLLRDQRGTYTVDNITSKPIIHPDLFIEPQNNGEVELHAERRVVYLCGALAVYNSEGKVDEIEAYPNIGDKRTAKVTLSATAIIEGWERGMPALQGKPLAA